MLYLDPSVLVAFWIEADALSARATAFFQAEPSIVVVSNLSAAEFASAIARLVRTQHLARKDAAGILDDFDNWRTGVAHPVEIASSDVDMAYRNIRRLDLNLRAPDAIHIAVAHRLSAKLATFDTRMAACARTLGVTVESV